MFASYSFSFFVFLASFSLGHSQLSYSDGLHLMLTEERLSVLTIYGRVIVETEEIKKDKESNQRFEVIIDSQETSFEVKLRSSIANETVDYKMPEKLVSLSDTEGRFGQFRKLLQALGVISENLGWSFGSGHLVLTGDFFDRWGYGHGMPLAHL